MYVTRINICGCCVAVAVVVLLPSASLFLFSNAHCAGIEVIVYPCDDNTSDESQGKEEEIPAAGVVYRAQGPALGGWEDRPSAAYKVTITKTHHIT